MGSDDIKAGQIGPGENRRDPVKLDEISWDGLRSYKICFDKIKSDDIRSDTMGLDHFDEFYKMKTKEI